MVAARVPFAAASGVLLSLAVFMGLWKLVSVPMGVPAKAAAVEIDFSPQRFDTPTETKRRDKPEREPPTREPIGPRVISDPTGDPATPFRPEPIKILGPARGRLPTMGVDRDVVPLVRVNPEYPAREQLRGTEGWVRVRFTVTPTGSVRDAVVVASEPRSVFDEAALGAVARWRYNPRVDGGVPVERVGLETIMRFELEN